MTSQQRVQAYIEKHRISALFEDLMARLTHHLPAEPVPFLIKVLSKFDEKVKKPGSSTTPGKKGATWAAASLAGMGPERGYERPWTSNMKKYKSHIGEVTSLQKPVISPVSRKPLSKTSSAGDAEHMFRKSPDKKGKHSATRQSQEDLLFTAPSGMSRPQEAARVEEQFLQEEMSAVKLTKKMTKEEDKFAPKEVTPELVKERHERPGNKAKKHKQELAQMVEAQLKVESLGYLDTGDVDGDPDSGGYEEATDMLEDASDLMDEGVVGVKASGKKSRRRAGSSEPEVKVTMCSKCARLVGSDDSSTTIGNGGYGKYASIDSFSEVSGADFAPARTAAHHAPSDDDFESASQVSGPRQPMWYDDASQQDGDTSKGNQSQNGGGGTYRLGQRSEAEVTGQGWDPASYDADTEVTNQDVNRGESLLEKGRSWAQPDSDDDSSY
ncbi:uncharacterized protein C8orf34 homolog isoform X2 [Amphiura filiformis]|uniref:uncharacterized protein C8orf34 homolog isoform X2 n=1 Tax=Amphiura filiformis TaxID=82378 RepID=UPI003B21E40F